MDNAVQRFNKQDQKFFVACGGMLRGRPQAGTSSTEGQSHAKSEAVWDLMVTGNRAWKISCIQGTFISKGILTTCVQLNHSFWNPSQWWYLFFTHSLLSPEDIKLHAIYNSIMKDNLWFTKFEIEKRHLFQCHEYTPKHPLLTIKIVHSIRYGRFSFSGIVYNYPPKGRGIVVSIYRDAKRRGIHLELRTDPEGDSWFSIYQISRIRIKNKHL